MRPVLMYMTALMLAAEVNQTAAAQSTVPNISALTNGSGQLVTPTMIGAVSANGGDASATVASAVDPTTKRTAAARAADIINVMDSHGGVPGAKGDDITDDTAAIKAAFAYARSLTMGAGQPYIAATGPFANIVFPTGRKFRINGSIDATGFHSQGLLISMQGSMIDCHATGLICVDATGSSEMSWDHFTVLGDATDTPKIALQIGRFSQTISADDHTFNELNVSGQFTLAGVLNEAAETTTFIHPKIANYYGALGSYALIQDGSNHFNAASTFQPISMPVDSPNSFNENLFIGADIRANVGDGTPLFIGDSGRHAFIRSYFAGGSPTCTLCTAAVIWNAGQPNSMLHFDGHVETNSLKSAFNFQGDPSQTPYGFEYEDQQPFATAAIFSAASNITYIELRGVDVKIGGIGNGAKLLDTPSIWQIGGRYSSTSAYGFNATQWQGPITTGVLSYFANYGTFPIQTQVTDSTTVGGNTRGNNAVDMQQVRSAATQVASGLQAVISGGTGNTASGGQSVVPGGQGNTASGQFSMAAGVNTIAKGSYSTAVGANSVAAASASTTTGVDGTDNGQPYTLTAGGPRDSGGGIGQHQITWAPWKIVTTSTAPTRVTADGAAPYVTTDSSGQVTSNCFAPQNGAAYQLTVTAMMQDITTNGSAYSWTGKALMLAGYSKASTSVTASSVAPDVITAGTTGGAAIALAADTTNGCLSVTWTAPNSDTWRGTVEVHAVHVGH